MHSAIRPLVCFIAFQLLPSASSCSESLGDIVLLRRTVRRPTAPFHRRLDLFLQGSTHWNFGRVVKKCVAKDHSVQLVGIADAFGDPPFGLLHSLSTLCLDILALRITGDIVRQRLSTLELWARLRPFSDSLNVLGDPQAFFSSSFQPFCSFLPSSVYALHQTPNT
ncbi:hypothetical protein H5410_031363 [Solanum commersonii]|uniref:Secreted protein n=1 Tax=Solanum commersonii TaxID=4109 RepID=A0A9J5YI71_SOLCO|nr:hypothetical protein H5410_031363 [Solanum commersonii]